MNDDRSTIEQPSPEGLDERAIARKYGLRELVYPDSEQLKALSRFLADAVENGRCGPVPKTAIVVMLEYLQQTVNRQHITKGPKMAHDEYEILQAPYYLAARVVSKLGRDKKEQAEKKGKLYQTTWVTLNQFIEILRSVLDPGCYWMRLKSIPEGVREGMDALNEFAIIYGDIRRASREAS